MIKSKLSLLAVILAAISTQAFADTSTKTFQSTATLSSSCVISTNNINFGTITPSKTGAFGVNERITSTCSKGVYVIYKLSAGGSGDITNRKMYGNAGNTDTLNYQIYRDSSINTVWGDGGGYNFARGFSGTGAAQDIGFYALLTLNQFVKPDTYSDNLTVTLSY